MFLVLPLVLVFCESLQMCVSTPLDSCDLAASYFECSHDILNFQWLRLSNVTYSALSPSASHADMFHPAGRVSLGPETAWGRVGFSADVEVVSTISPGWKTPDLRL